MTDFNELAQRIVAQGIGSMQPSKKRDWGYRQFIFDKYGMPFACDAERFCNDGRVVLALMEKATEAGWYPTGCPGSAATVARSATPVYGPYLERNADSLAIAIVLACLDALEVEK